MSPHGAPVTAIVPTRNHAEALPGLFEALLGAEVYEVLLCDHGSIDATLVEARARGASVFTSRRGWAEGLNRSAERARGGILWFLSPWCRPPQHAGEIIALELSLSRAAAGCFRLRSGQRHWAGWWRARKRDWAMRWGGRVTLLHGPFVTMEAFARAGGFPEDATGAAALFRRLRRTTRRLILPDRITVPRPGWTSPDVGEASGEAVEKEA